MIGGVLIFSIKLAGVMLALFLALGWLQNFHPAFDSFSHFRLIAIAALALVALLLIFTASWMWPLACAVVMGVSIALTYPFLPGLGPKVTVSDLQTLRVIQFNLRFNNKRIDDIAAAILSQDADVVLIQELTPLNFDILDQIKERFPYQLECNSRSRGSVALVSRHPFVKLGQQQCLRKLGFVFAQIQVGDREITFASFHSKWPWPQSQPRQVAALAQTFSTLPSPLILAGDFNAAPWSAVVRKVANLSRTKIVEGAAFSWRPVWRGRRDLMPELLPLDQIMASDDLIPIARRLMQDGGSDHLPVLTEFIWKEER